MMSWNIAQDTPPPLPHNFHRVSGVFWIINTYLEQGAGGEGRAAQAELWEGLGAAKTGGAAAVTAASVKAAVEKPTAG